MSRILRTPGVAVVEVFCEPGASALDDDRAVFQEMIYTATRPDRPFGSSSCIR